MKMLLKIKLHPTTIVYFGLSLLSGHFKQFLFIFFIVLFHEAFHTITALIYKFDVKKIMVMPFGAFVEIGDFGHHRVLDELIVVIMGLFSHVVMTILFYLSIKCQILSNHSYQFCMSVNLAVFYLNLLPIWPLDGAKILHLLFSYILSYKKCIFLVSLTSIIFFSLFVAYNGFQVNGYIIYCYLIFQIYQFYMNMEYMYFNFLFTRRNKNEYFKKKFHQNNEFHRPYDNIYLYNKRIYSEKEFIKKELKL